MSALPDSCPNCGAPRAAGLAECRFCKVALVSRSQEEAVPCPGCGVLCEWGSQQCPLCHAWVVVQCIFCHALSPHHLVACLSCGEAFAGSQQRFAARRRAAGLEAALRVAGETGGIAANILGAMAGSMLLSEYEHRGVLPAQLDDDDRDDDD